MTIPPPVTIKVNKVKLRRRSRQLEVTFDNGDNYSLSCELLRVYSPSASNERASNERASNQIFADQPLITHKKDVNIDTITPVGNYAIKIGFSDGHDTGLFSWAVLHHLATNQVSLWQSYLARIRAAKASREPLINVKIKYHPDHQ